MVWSVQKPTEHQELPQEIQFQHFLSTTPQVVLLCYQKTKMLKVLSDEDT